MNQKEFSRPVKALGLCSGGLDSILSALLLKKQGIDVTWISFETPFFGPENAKKAAKQTNIPLIIKDITSDYMKMMRNPKAGFGKNMNPCMDCHALMFQKAGEIMLDKGFSFLFSGEVVGQRPKSQNKNSLRYVEKNSTFDGKILRPLSARRLPETWMEKQGLVDRTKLLDISGRSRKVQIQLAKEFGILEFPSPAGGCLLTDKGFSVRLKDLMDHPPLIEKRHLNFLKSGRHFRIDPVSKVIVGRSKQDNRKLTGHMDYENDVLVKHGSLPGPDVILTGDCSEENLKTAGEICAAYTRSQPGEPALIRLLVRKKERLITVITPDRVSLKPMII